jgi:hypothetical protein
MVEPVTQFEADGKAVRALASADAPPKRVIRSKVVFEVGYGCGCGNASGKGFGSIILINGVVQWLSGQWMEDYEAESLNRLELANIVIALEEYAMKHHWITAELFIFTDNFVTKYAYF